MTEWISIKDKPVPENEYVLLFAKPKKENHDYSLAYLIPRIFAAEYNGLDFTSAHGDGWVPFHNEEITHWMYLPNPPKDP